MKKALLQRIAPHCGIAALSILAYGGILFSGAGFSHPDDVPASMAGDLTFRPLLTMTYLVNREIGGWMLTNLILHVSCALLLLGLSRSFAAAALFSVHPMAADAVASVAGRSALLTGVLLLAFLLLMRRHWRFGLYGAIVLALAMGMKLNVFSVAAKGVTSGDHAYHYLSGLMSYVWPNMVIPAKLSADPDVPKEAVAAMLAVFGLGLAALSAIRKPEFRLGLGLLVLPLMPYLFIPLPDVFLDHRGYPALAGAAILLGKLMPRSVAMATCGLFIVLSIGRAEVYSSSLRLYEDAAPKSLRGRPWHNLGFKYAEAGDTVRAKAALRRAIELDPMLEPSHGNLAALELFSDPRPQELRLERGLKLPGNFSEASRILDNYSQQRKDDNGR